MYVDFFSSDLSPYSFILAYDRWIFQEIKKGGQVWGIFLNIFSKIWDQIKQECIPLWCVPRIVVDVRGYLWQRPPPDIDPQD